MGHIRIVFSLEFAFIWILYEFFVLCYEVYIKCCLYAGKSSEAGTYSTHLLLLRYCIIQKSLHYTETKIYINMVLKRTAFIVLCDVAIILGHITISFSLKFAFIWIPYEYFVLYYEAYIKYCLYTWKSNVAGTYSTHLLSLQCRIIQKLLHYTETKFYIHMVLKRTAFYCIVWPTYKFRTH